MEAFASFDEINVKAARMYNADLRVSSTPFSRPARCGECCSETIIAPFRLFCAEDFLDLQPPNILFNMRPGSLSSGSQIFNKLHDDSARQLNHSVISFLRPKVLIAFNGDRERYRQRKERNRWYMPSDELPPNVA